MMTRITMKKTKLRIWIIKKGIRKLLLSQELQISIMPLRVPAPCSQSLCLEPQLPNKMIARSIKIKCTKETKCQWCIRIMKAKRNKKITDLACLVEVSLGRVLLACKKEARIKFRKNKRNRYTLLNHLTWRKA